MGVLQLSVGRVALAALAGLGLYVLLSSIPSVNYAISSFIARITALSLTALGTGVVASGPIIEVSGLQFLTVADCTPLAPIFLVAAAMLVFPSDRRDKIRGIFFGSVILVAINLVRMTSLVYIGIYRPEWLEVAHLLVWQAVMIFAAVVIWLYWLQRLTRGARA